MKSNTYSFAEHELDILSKSATDPDNRPIIEPFREEILSLCEAFGKSGQSGGSAPYTATAISQAVKKLMLQEPIMPMTGIDEEWVDVGHLGSKDEKECVYQNRRCSNLFKNSEGRAWYLDAIIWKGDTPGESGNDWDTFTGNVEGILSRQYVKSFPFIPKTFYIDVTRETLTADWTQEPFIEWDYYDTKHFEQTGEKVWQKEKYRYIIKNKRQLNRVWKYYDKYQ
jgi:hypothetical protein